MDLLTSDSVHTDYHFFTISVSCFSVSVVQLHNHISLVSISLEYCIVRIGPTIINFGFFSRPYNLIKGPTFIKFWKTLQNKNKRMTVMPRLMRKSIKLLMPYVYSRPYVYSFWQIFHALRLFPAYVY